MRTPGGRPALHLVDAFAGEPGRGNRAAVVMLREGVSDDWLESTARVLSHPATAYLWRRAADRYALRWFTPAYELHSCGHGTLAAAHVLFTDEDPPDRITFDTGVGPLTAVPTAQGVEIAMPAERLAAWAPDSAVGEQLGADIVDAARSRRHGLVRVADEEVVRSLRPDLAALAALPVVGLAVTAAGRPPYDIVSRWFVPRLGLEDQATGTAHCLLAPYWSARLGRREFTAYQASVNGAEFGVAVRGDRVHLTGRATTLVRGELALHPPYHDEERSDGED